MSASTHSQSSRSSSSASQPNCLDPLDALLDFSEYEPVSYQSPSISPSSSKPQFVRPVASTPNATNALLSSSQQTLSGPSHNYELYKQQTGIPTGAIANTLAMNTNNMFSYGYMSGISPGEDFIDFGTAPTQSASGYDMDLEFDSPSTEPAFFFPDTSMNPSSEYVNPSVIGGQESQSMQQSSLLSTQSSNVGRLWPGMHQQQAALAKAQQQQKQQQHITQQQRAQSTAQPKQQRTKSHPPTDPIVEEKISQLLNSMRQSSVTTSENDDATTPNGANHSKRNIKEEEEMDEDERLLASEEGKKLSSKERRQLRNKVSARAFRSRRKEYIGQLEGEIATKVNENSDLRAQNRALLEENTRLSDLTRMLLSSPSFSGFLDTLTPNVHAAPQQSAPTPVPVEQAPVENRQIRKDVNPYTAQQQLQNQQINLAIIPEHNIDFSMVDFTHDSLNYQPQVFSVIEMPEIAIDTAILSGKSSNFVGSLESDDVKVELPVIERMPVKEIAPVEVAPVVDDEFDANPAFALFSHAASHKTQPESPLDPEFAPIFGGIEPEKAFARIELVDATTAEVTEAISMVRVERICSRLDDITARLENMTLHL